MARSEPPRRVATAVAGLVSLVVTADEDRSTITLSSVDQAVQALTFRAGRGTVFHKGT
jgi:stage V sporulation protein SpoVS